MIVIYRAWAVCVPSNKPAAVDDLAHKPPGLMSYVLTHLSTVHPELYVPFLRA